METQLHLCQTGQLYQTVCPVENERAIDFISTKPRMGGLWTSTYNQDEHSSMWVDYARQQVNFIKVESCSWWLLTPDPQARILTIATERDVERLYGCYRLRNGSIHYEAMAVSYDALHLSYEAIKSMRESEFVEEWDVESTLWMNWKFTAMQWIAALVPMEAI